jgi:hypothetical protein
MWIKDIDGDLKNLNKVGLINIYEDGEGFRVLAQADGSYLDGCLAEFSTKEEAIKFIDDLYNKLNMPYESSLIYYNRNR